MSAREHDAGSEHIVRFYETDDHVCAGVAEFVAEGLRSEEHVLVLVTAEHWRDICARLAASDVSCETAIERRQLMVADAEALLDETLLDGVVEKERFARTVTPLLCQTGTPQRVYSEVMSLLVGRANLEAALALEEFGHDVAHRVGARVLCAYDLRHLRSGRGSEEVQAVCACHDHAEFQPLTDGRILLLADDARNARELYKEYLEFKGYQVVVAADRSEAVERARERKPDIILLDVRLPGSRMTDTEAMRLLKNDGAFAGVPIVALTAQALEAEREAFVAEGFDAVISKPCLPDELIAAVERLIAKRRIG